MKRTALISLFSVVTLVFLLSAGMAFTDKAADSKPYTLAKLTEQIEKLEKKEITLTGTIVGVCKSGCKMWIADGEYKEGNPFALVRAKDDAFKFDTEATGKKVILHGYAVAKYMDYCAERGEEQEGAMKECAAPVGTEKEAEKEADPKGKVKDVTFYATTIVYE